MLIGRKVAFLDRDGVINEDFGYVHTKENFIFIDGVFEACRELIRHGFEIIIITNQAGIARGMYSEAAFCDLMCWVVRKFNENNISILKTYHCPHHPDFTGGCMCRKPNPGMLLEAHKEFDIDLKNSIIIGDKVTDLEAGINAGVGKQYLVGCHNPQGRDEFSKLIDVLNYINITRV